MAKPDGRVVTADAALRPPPAFQDLAHAILARVRCLLPNSWLELDHLRKDLPALDTPFAVVPLGVDADTYLNADPEPFVRRHGLKDFVLQVSRIEARRISSGWPTRCATLTSPSCSSAGRWTKPTSSCAANTARGT